MRTEINNTELQQEMTFLNLIEYKRILIPKIQRDYAQGRLDKKASDIRDGFLIELIEALTEMNGKSLILDFVYGSTQDNSVFVPLDGQQRLTTLFLLHWYLAAKENLSALRIRITNNLSSRFSYETRISSKDFCDVLVLNSYSDLKEKLNTQFSAINAQIEEYQDDADKGQELEKAKKTLCLSGIIKDQSWFIWAWRKDPTIKAILVMLDDLDQRLGKASEDTRKEMWEKLQAGKIAFHLLPLEKFNLTDELYVKMNARGKELSSFDIFRSTLEEQMRLNNVDEKTQNVWRENFDSNWIDLFWNKLAKPKLADGLTIEKQLEYVDSVEDGYLIFLKRMMEYHLFINDNCLQCNWNDENIIRYLPLGYDTNNILNWLRVHLIRHDVLSFLPLFCKTKYFSQSFFEFIIKSFKSLIYKVNESKHEGSDLIEGICFENNQTSLFESFIKNKIDYDTRIQIFSLLQFFKYHNADEVSKDRNLISEFNSWMRITRNLTTGLNIFYDSYKQFEETLYVFEKWSENLFKVNSPKTVINYFSELSVNDAPKGRNASVQFEEEITKAKLMCDPTNGTLWATEIRSIEEHKYFLGQISFLLEWSKIEGVHDIEAFQRYLNGVKNIFNENGLKSELAERSTHYFRNALMANCKYYLLNNDSFVYHTDKDRDRSWKSYLRDIEKSKNIKLLLDKWQATDLSFLEFCKNESNTAKSIITDWRRCFINKPEVYNLSTQHQIAYWNKNNMEVRLLETSTTWNGNNRHSELNTYYWNLLFDDVSGWKSEYKNSQQENSLCAIFKKNGNLEVSVRFEVRDGLNKYVVRLNFTTENNNFLLNADGFIKENIFDTNQYNDVESYLDQILK